MSIFTRRSAEVSQPIGGTAFSLARLLGQQAYDTDPIRTDGDALKSYSGWVYACVSTISQDVRSSTWNVWQKSGASRNEWKALEDSQLPEPLVRPNGTQTFADLLELTQVHMDLAGRAFWHLVTNGPGGKVVGIQALNPDWVTKAVYNEARTQLVGWELSVSGSGRRVLPADDVILFRYPDPVDPVAGMSPIRAVAMSADMDTYSRAYAASHLRNHAQPTGILTTESELTRDQAATLSEAWTDSHQGTSKIQVLGKGAQFQVLSAHIKDLEFLNLARVSRDQILSAYHVPSSKLGLIEDSSRANGEESDRTYSALCLGPRLRRYHDPISHRLLPRLGLDPSRYAFEFDPVEVADKTFDRDAAQTAFNAGAITLDEYRERIGFQPEANGNGSVYFVPMGSTVVENPETGMAPMSVGSGEPSEPIEVSPGSAERGEAGPGESLAKETVLNGAQVTSLIAVVQAMMGGSLPYDSALEIVQSAFGMSLEKALRILGPEENAGSAASQSAREPIPEPSEDEDEEAVESRSLEEVEVESKDLEDPTEEQIEIAALRFLSAQGESERRLKGRIRAVFSKMQKAVLSEFRKNERSIPGAETRAPIPELNEIISEFDDELQMAISDEGERAFGEGFSSFSQELPKRIPPSLHIDFNLIAEDVTRWALEESAKKVVGITEETQTQVQKIVSSSLEEGQSMTNIADKLAEKFDEFKGVRSETIARTETANAYNYGKLTNAEAFDKTYPEFSLTKTWVPTQDDRTRESHRAGAIKNRAGQVKRTVPINEPFRVDGEDMMRPLDPNGSAKNVIRCRCVMTMDVKEN